MAFPQGQNTLSFKILTDMTDLLNDLEQAGRQFEGLTVYIARVTEHLNNMSATDLNKLQSDFAELPKAMADLADETERAKIVMLGMMQDYGNNLDRVVEALKKVNAENRAWNEANKDQIAPGDERQVLDERAIQRAAKEMENLRNILGLFERSSTSAFGTFNMALGVVVEASQNARGNVNVLKDAIITTMQQSGMSVRDLSNAFRLVNEEMGMFTAQEVNQALSEVQAQVSQSDRALEDYLATMREVQGAKWGDALPIKELQETEQAVSGLNGISQIFFGTTLAGIGLQVLNRLKQSLREVIGYGEEWSRTMFNMSTAVRALQRTGVEITIAQMGEQVDKLRSQFSFFTTRELQEGIAQIALLTRNVGLTRDEMFELSEATATLAIITGKDFAEQGLLVARSIASGYTEALQRAGIAANRLAIQEKALTMGINKSFLQMTEQERAAVTLALVLDQVAAISEDTAEFQKTLAGRLQQTNVAIQEQKDSIGKELLPIWVALREEVLVPVSKAILAFTRGIKTFAIQTAASLAALYTAMWAVINASDALKEQGKGFWDVYREGFNQFLQGMNEQWTDVEMPDVPDDQIGMFAQDYTGKIESELKEKFSRLKEAFQRIWLDFVHSLQDLEIDLSRDLQDITRDYFRDVEENWIDYYADIAKVNRDSNYDIQDANEKFRLKELKAEEDFQEKMRQLREKFILDLEDALRERDAKQVLKLIREYNLKRTQMTREENIAKAQREREFQAELADIERQRQRRLYEMEVEFGLRREKMRRQWEQEKEDRQRKFEQDIQDLERERDRKFEILRDGLEKEEQAWLDHAKAVTTIATDTAAGLTAIFAQMWLTIGALSNLGSFGINLQNYVVPGVLPGGSSSMNSSSYVGDQAEGGTIIARKPTVAVFGERGKEAATFTPLSRTGRNVGTVRNAGGGMGGLDSGNLSVRIFLTPGLKAEIVDMALDGTAEIIEEGMRR